MLKELTVVLNKGLGLYKSNKIRYLYRLFFKLNRIISDIEK
jgi:hypothetical protein